MSSNSRLPLFSEALTVFQNFLQQEGAPTNIVWVWREDVTTYRRRIWVRLHDQAESLRIAEAHYAAAQVRDLGLNMCALCKLGDSTAAYLWAPRDEIDASYAMQPRSLKCSIPVPLVTGTKVTSRLGWMVRCEINRRRRDGNTILTVMPARNSRRNETEPPMIRPEPGAAGENIVIHPKPAKRKNAS